MSVSYVTLLREKIRTRSLQEGRQTHKQLQAIGRHKETYIGNFLIHLYGECNCLHEARSAFNQIHYKNIFSWTILLAAHTKNGLISEARELLQKFPMHNAVAWTALIAVYAQKGHLREARRELDSMPFPSVVPCNMMITGYAQNGLVPEAKEMFDAAPERDVVSWNALISAYAQNGQTKQGIDLFSFMNLEGVTPDCITLVTVIDACTRLGAFSIARNLHGCIQGADTAVYTALVNMYGKCGRLEEAIRVFEVISDRDVVSWTAIIAVHSQNSRARKALEFFQRMTLEGVAPNRVTFVTVLDSCAELESCCFGECIRQEVMFLDVITGTALVKMYGKFRCIEKAEAIFYGIREEVITDAKEQWCFREDVVLWNAMISAYACSQLREEGVHLFYRLFQEGIRPDKLTFVAVLEISLHGQAVHNVLKDLGYESDVMVATALVNMYGRRGSLESARDVFDGMKVRSRVTWNAMVGAYAENGYVASSHSLYREMELDGVTGDRVTFVSVLFASSHGGLLRDAFRYFVSLQGDGDICPDADHYRCIADLLGRLGELEDAEEVLNSVPFEPDCVAWMALLGSCKTQGDLERAYRIANLVIELDPINSAAVLLFGNTPAATTEDDDIEWFVT